MGRSSIFAIGVMVAAFLVAMMNFVWGTP